MAINKKRVLFAIPTQTHVAINTLEATGLQKLGYECEICGYAAKDGYSSKLAKLSVLLSNAFKMIRAAYKFKPGVVYINSRLELVGSSRDFITILLFRIFYFGRPLFVIKSHGSNPEVLENKSFFTKKLAFPFLRNNVSGWLMLSQEERQLLWDYNYFRKETVFVIKNIVANLPNFKPDASFRQKYNIPSTHKILFYGGRMLPEKGVNEVVKAFIDVHGKYPAKLLMVGDGTELESLKKMAAEANILQDVVFTGFIPEEAVIEFYSNADVLIFPTYAAEGFSMVLFNSVAAGMAIITTPVRAAKDYLSDPENCLWVEPMNYKSVSAGLERILTEDDLYANMRNNNKTLGIQFGVDIAAVELNNIINQLS